MSESSADDKDWKSRYLKEASEWESSDQLLRRVLGRVAMAAEGSSAALDAVLERIQTYARERNDSMLDEALDELTRQINLLDVTTESAPVPEPLVAPAPAAGKGDAREVLLALIDEVAVTQPGLGSLETLREKLQSEGSGDWYRILDRVMGEVRGLIQRINADKQVLEQLMIEVSDELGDITQVLVEDQSGLRAGQEQTEALRDAMASGVQSIQTHIESASDIASLKAGVHQSLEGMRKGIGEFVEKDAQRFAESEARNASLQQRVASMEGEARELQEKLQQNREKLMLDSLTGAHSRHAYDETLAQEVSRFKRYGDGFALAVLDIDHFKRVNDSYGHAAGDKALKLVASLIIEQIRDPDYLFRVGGEEFVLLLPNTGIASARPLVERVRAAVGDSGFHFESKPVPMTISAGLAEIRSEDDGETLFARADDALYRAKKSGRDQLVSLA